MATTMKMKEIKDTLEYFFNGDVYNIKTGIRDKYTRNLGSISYYNSKSDVKTHSNQQRTSYKDLKDMQKYNKKTRKQGRPSVSVKPGHMGVMMVYDYKKKEKDYRKFDVIDE